MKIKRNLLLICVFCISIMVTGCGDPLFVMTAEEESIITLYASKTVSKFNKNQSTGICNARVKTGELDEDYEADQETEEEVPENPEEETPLDEENPDMETGTIDEEIPDSETEVDSEESGYSFTNAMGIDGVEFSFSSFDVSDVFQTSAYATNKVNGKKYVVLHIDAVNNSGSSVDFSTISDRTYSLSIGEEKAEVVCVPVSNNLDTYDGVMKSGAEKSFVLVFLFNESSLENMSSLELFVTSDGTTRGTTI